MKAHQQGFALLDVLLAVILMAIASYGTYMVAKSFQTASSVQTLEQRAITIAQNYMPFLQDTTTTSAIDEDNNKLANDFLTSVGIPNSALVNTSDGYSFVYTESYCGGSNQAKFNFAQELDDTTTGGSYLAIGFGATGAQLNQIIQDVNTTFSIYYADEGTALNSSSEATALVDADNGSKVYAVYLLFPKISTTPDIGLTANQCSS